MRKSLKAATFAAVLMLGSLTPGCYGPFNATRNLWKWNGSIEGKWGQEGVFLLCSIIPVYGLFMLGDALIFNSIQFWGGDNPIELTADVPRGEIDQVAALVGLPVEVVTVPAAR
jgi:hypothetical protein